MTSSIPAAVDYLVGIARQSAGTANAVVADGWTDEPAPTMFGIGADEPPFFEGETTTVQSTPTWVGPGSRHIEEDYTIPCYIYVGTGGASNQTVRQAAFALWDGFLSLFIADITLGGALKGGRTAEISNLSAQGPKTSEEAQGGRFCLIKFSVRCTNLETD